MSWQNKSDFGQHQTPALSELSRSISGLTHANPQAGYWGGTPTATPNKWSLEPSWGSDPEGQLCPRTFCQRTSLTKSGKTQRSDPVDSNGQGATEVLGTAQGRRGAGAQGRRCCPQTVWPGKVDQVSIQRSIYPLVQRWLTIVYCLHSLFVVSLLRRPGAGFGALPKLIQKPRPYSTWKPKNPAMFRTRISCWATDPFL